MPYPFFRSSLVLAILILTSGLLAQAGNWPQWRGPGGNGVSDEIGLPDHWDQHSHLAWKSPLEGEGASTPAIWGNAIFVTAQRDEALLLIKMNKTTGTVDWTRQVGTGSPRRGPLKAKEGEDRRQQKFHRLHNMASPSPVTDGNRVIVHFGNGDLVAYDFAGQELWRHNLQKEYGTYTIWWGHANSPLLYGDLVISVCMQDSLADLPGQQTESYLVAYDKDTGKVKWKKLRMTGAKEEEGDSYTTPILHEGPSGAEVIVMGSNQIDAYDPITGRQLWFLPGIVGGRTITGPTLGSELVYATQGKRGPLLAIRLDGKGKLDSGAIAWKALQSTPDSSTPVYWNGLLFWVTDDGLAQCHDARTGTLKWKERLPGDYKASPVVAEDRVYFLNLSGLCTVLKAGPKFEKIASNPIGDETIASPALSDGQIFLRGKQTLYCLKNN